MICRSVSCFILLLFAITGSSIANASGSAVYQPTNNSKLLIAVQKGEAEKTKKLLSQGANANARDEKGATALMLAASKGRDNIVQILLQAGSDVQAKDKTLGAPVLYWAAESCNASILRTLIDAGADVNGRAGNGATALTVAAGMCSTEILDVLIQAGADPLLKDEIGSTPLMQSLAFQANFQYLLQHISKSGISEITLLRPHCALGCPNYEITFKLDGSAEYRGFEEVERKGQFRGKVLLSDFQRLAELAQKLNFESLKDEYSIPLTDQAYAITKVTRAGATKSVRDYGNGGPVELWGLEMAIDALAAQVRWEQIPESAQAVDGSADAQE